ncbi:hypothetical protein RQP46_009020 [Phenoliferia psychrophenolica]
MQQKFLESNFSKDQAKRFIDNMKARNDGKNVMDLKAVTCKQCTAVQQLVIYCTSCETEKASRHFSKNQRSADNAICLPCQAPTNAYNRKKRVRGAHSDSDSDAASDPDPDPEPRSSNSRKKSKPNPKVLILKRNPYDDNSDDDSDVVAEPASREGSADEEDEEYDSDDDYGPLGERKSVKEVREKAAIEKALEAEDSLDLPDFED